MLSFLKALTSDIFPPYELIKGVAFNTNRSKNEGISLKTGDAIIEGGFPGHTVMTVDEVVNERTGKKLYLIAQSFMSAQSIYILKNLNHSLSSWYRIDGKDNQFLTSFWTFTDQKNYLKRFFKTIY